VKQAITLLTSQCCLWKKCSFIDCGPL